MVFSGLSNSRLIYDGTRHGHTYVESVQSISGTRSGVSIQVIGCPSNPLNGILLPSSACDIMWIVPSASPNAIKVPVGEMDIDVI
jgi:hypothetical protein